MASRQPPRPQLDLTIHPSQQMYIPITMASAGDPATAADTAGHMFNEDEDLLDDDDESSDHDEDDSASSAAIALDRLPPTASAAAQVTIAVPGVSDPLLNQQKLQHQPETKKPLQLPPPPPADESRKLFQRLWTDEDEIELLQGFLDYTTQRLGSYSSSQHHHDTTTFYDQIKSKFQLDFNKNQLVEKLRRLKKKYRNAVSKFGSGKDYTFKSPHDQVTFQISSKIWGNSIVNVNGSPAFRATPVAVEEDDDELNHPNFVSCQSPNPSGFDVNSKTPRPRKRNRTSTVKLEDKQQQKQHPSYPNINNIQPPAVAAAPIAAPVLGMGISGAMSNVIEETVKSCLSPIFKELFCNSMGSNLYPNGLCCGHGFGSRSPIPLCFPGSMGGEKMGDERWRKQQILELEVFSKRLELVQDQIRDQLQELRSMRN